MGATSWLHPRGHRERKIRAAQSPCTATCETQCCTCVVGAAGEFPTQSRLEALPQRRNRCRIPMIPRDYITEWRKEAPWIENFQVEQDLVISRALVNLFSHPLLSSALAFGGGTALYKLHLKPPARYSEDIDLVQTAAEPAGKMMEAGRGGLDSWLGKPQWKQTEGRVTFVYRFDSEDSPPIRLRLKIEINSREHFRIYDVHRVPFTVTSRWFEGSCDIHT